ncbi:permease-like cell division protein FtsX [Actinacidiphila bryophytorum]|uniref:Cell division protein FtsX n=1 Tax=Actinacidiphila bryophytorum TaxID=1436133 RepID=A0A9W4GXT8_9ACTN|nr:permease-like cell division protein FtsX [Actinacidiphila bryophytorum]MBM9434260.1 ABC transporter permease [Actinacidiphila bryophytorum]MBN6543985.1 ABC transporter permease [Actinacidiphila bryophytorum]CAG7624050.1 Cell division protein FtsX [Actinacidiphila bryophytorum]
MRLQFFLSEIGVGLRRNLTMTFAVIISVALSLALAGGALLANKQVDSMKGYWYDKVQVTVYMCNKSDATSTPSCAKGAVTDDQKKAILADLKKLPIVEKVYFETAEGAYKNYEQQFKNSPMAASITPDQMQENYRVKLKDPTKFTVIASAFQGRPGVQSVEDQRAVLKNLFSLLGGMTKAAYVVLAFMLTVAMLLIINTVRVSAFSRRRETGIMRLVGASSFYIQMPFIMEAAFAGLVGAAVACVMLLGGRYFMIDAGLKLQDKIPLVSFLGWDSVVQVLPLVLLIGFLMPATAAFIALRRYLRV